MLRKMKRAVCILFKIGRDQLRQTDGGHEAGGDATRERLPRTRQYRQPGPQRIAGRRVCVVEMRVKKQLSVSQSCEVVRLRRQMRGETEPFGINAAKTGLTAQVRL